MTTDNRMEMTATIEALAALKRPNEVRLHIDSMYLRDGITQFTACAGSGAAPGRAPRAVFEDDAGDREVGADAVGCRKVAFLASGIAFFDLAFDPFSATNDSSVRRNAGIYSRGRADAFLQPVPWVVGQQAEDVGRSQQGGFCPRLVGIALGFVELAQPVVQHRESKRRAGVVADGFNHVCGRLPVRPCRRRRPLRGAQRDIEAVENASRLGEPIPGKVERLAVMSLQQRQSDRLAGELPQQVM